MYRARTTRSTCAASSTSPHLVLLRLLAAGLDGEVHELDTEVPAEVAVIVVVRDRRAGRRSGVRRCASGSGGRRGSAVGARRGSRSASRRRSTADRPACRSAAPPRRTVRGTARGVAPSAGRSNSMRWKNTDSPESPMRSTCCSAWTMLPRAAAMNPAVAATMPGWSGHESSRTDDMALVLSAQGEARDRGRGGGVERVDAVGHRDPHGGGERQQFVAQSRPARIRSGWPPVPGRSRSSIDARVGVGRQRQDLESVEGAQIVGEVARPGVGECERGPHRHPQRSPGERVGARVIEDQAVPAERCRVADDRADVGRVVDGFERRRGDRPSAASSATVGRAGRSNSATMRCGYPSPVTTRRTSIAAAVDGAAEFAGERRHVVDVDERGDGDAAGRERPARSRGRPRRRTARRRRRRASRRGSPARAR